MPKVVKYAGVINNITLPGGGGGVFSKKIPCFGARTVMLTARAVSGAFALGAVVTQTYGAVQADAGFAGATGLGVADGFSAKLVTGNGATFVWSANTGPYIMWPFIAIGVNPNATGGNDIIGFTVDAYVTYDGDRDMLDLGQGSAIAL